MIFDLSFLTLNVRKILTFRKRTRRLVAEVATIILINGGRIADLQSLNSAGKKPSSPKAQILDLVKIRHHYLLNNLFLY